MNRTGRLRAIFAATMDFTSEMQQDPLMRSVMGLSKQKKRTRKVWTCRKCGNKFRPNVSNSLCDDCIKARDRR